jgi:flavodoxin
MKVIIAYMSQTGNTRKIAEAIFQEIQAEKEIKELNEIDDLEGYDLAFVGFPMHGFGAPQEAKSFLEKHCMGKKIALFVTHGAPENFGGLEPWLAECKEAATGANVIDMFNCQGEMSQYVIDELLKSDDPEVRSWGEAGPLTRGQPDATRVERARLFAREIIRKKVTHFFNLFSPLTKFLS